MLIIKNSNLSPIPQLQFIQNGTEIISYRSLTEKQFCGNLLIAVSVGDQPDDIQLPFADVFWKQIIKSVGGLQEFRDFGYDLCGRIRSDRSKPPEGPEECWYDPASEDNPLCRGGGLLQYIHHRKK